MSFSFRLRLWLWGWCSRLLLLPVFVRYLWLSRLEPAYRRRWGERLGWVSCDQPGALWVHAVSLGEVRAAIPLVEELLALGQQILLTCHTPAGAQQVRSQFGERVQHCLAPLDTPGSVRRFLDRASPRALVLIEAELWPGLLFSCRRRNIPVLLANARMSEHSARGYGRWVGLFGPLFAGIRRVLARTSQDRYRLVELGFTPDKVEVAGDLKYCLRGLEQTRHQSEELAAQMGLGEGRQLMVAGSTHPGEEELLLEAMRSLWQQQPQLLLVLAPRQPRRFEQVSVWLQEQGVKWHRRSAGGPVPPATQVLLLDGTGELGAWYFLATVAFVGGSLVPAGGHNVLEPAAAACPVLTGAHLDNFAEAAEQLERAGALRRVDSAAALAQMAGAALADPADSRKRGEEGLALVVAGQGSLEHHLKAVQSLLEDPAA